MISRCHQAGRPNLAESFSNAFAGRRCRLEDMGLAGNVPDTVWCFNADRDGPKSRHALQHTQDAPQHGLAADRKERFVRDLPELCQNIMLTITRTSEYENGKAHAVRLLSEEERAPSGRSLGGAPVRFMTQG